MIKAYSKYLLYLSIVLLSGYCLLSANSYKEYAQYLSVTHNSQSAYASLSTTPNLKGLPLAIPSSSSKGDKNYRILAEVNEAEEDEFISKKASEHGFYFTTSQANLPDYFSYYIKNRLSFHKHFSHFTSFESRYIVFHDIRI